MLAIVMRDDKKTLESGKIMSGNTSEGGSFHWKPVEWKKEVEKRFVLGSIISMGKRHLHGVCETTTDGEACIYSEFLWTGFVGLGRKAAVLSVT